MSDAQHYDMKNLEALRRDLQEIRTEAQADGTIAPRAGKRAGPMAAAAARRPAPAQPVSPEAKGKQVATRMLATLRRVENDNSPIIRGTDFTEAGVKRLLNLLTSPKRRSDAADRALQRIHRFITAPAPAGVQTISGVSADKVRALSRLLEQIEQNGWDAVRSQLTERREKSAAAGTAGAAPAEAAPAPRKRAGRQAAS
jgi:hypothetical protein